MRTTLGLVLGPYKKPKYVNSFKVIFPVLTIGAVPFQYKNTNAACVVDGCQ